jgi:hypothetical protein
MSEELHEFDIRLDADLVKEFAKLGEKCGLNVNQVASLMTVMASQATANFHEELYAKRFVLVDGEKETEVYIGATLGTGDNEVIYLKTEKPELEEADKPE